MTRKSNLKYALALLISASAGSLAVATPATAQDMANFQRYADSGYTYCDAKLMGAIYGEDPYQGKLIIGQKIANGIGSNIPLMLRDSRNRGNRCEWVDVPHSYDDAVALGNYWGVSTSQAKAKAATFYTNGQSGAVTDALRYGGGEQAENEAAIQRFGFSGFTYCDAKMIGAYFQQSAYEGKIFIGRKIGVGLIDNIPWYLQRAREGGNKCQWGEGPYGYDDAVKLARMWNKDVAATKTTIANMVTLGRSDVIDASLGR